MKRLANHYIAFLGIVSIAAFSCDSSAQVHSNNGGAASGAAMQSEGLNWEKVLSYAENGAPAPDRRVDKAEAEWKEILTPEQFQVTRNAGTERAFTGEHYNNYDPGVYACICCGTPLFRSEQKFNSGTGWPSFTAPLKDNAINYHADHSFGMTRVEVECSACDAHLGHVFDDGPNPTGLRYCINSVCLEKISEEKAGGKSGN